MDPIFDDVDRVEQCLLVSSTTYLIPRNYIVTKKLGENQKNPQVWYTEELYTV